MRTHSNYTDLMAAWIVALALVALMAVHAFMPLTPPRLGHGVSQVGSARVGASLSQPARDPDVDLPLMEFADPYGPALSDDNEIATRPASSGSDLGTTDGRSRG
jgi:hypothetical protein